MAKSLSSLWLKNLRRLSKTQSQSRKVLKAWLPQPAKPKRAPAKPAAKSAVKPAARRASKAAKPAAKPSASAAALELAGLPGQWSRHYFAALTPPGRAALATHRMPYWLYLPAKASAAPRPLVVMLHGCQQSAPDFAAASRMNALAERKGFAVLYPQQSAGADRHRCWHWYKRSIQDGGGEVAVVAQLIAKVRAQHQFDPSRTYAAGLSAGAALAALVALHHPDLIAALGMHSGPVFGSSDSPMSAYRAMQQGGRGAHTAAARNVSRLADFPGMPVMIFHGDHDAVVRRINADELVEQFVIVNGASITSEQPLQRAFPARAGRSPQRAMKTTTYYAGRKAVVVRCDVATLGHAWSGGSASVPFSAPEGPNASSLLWDFFALHSRGARRAPTII